MKTAGRNDPCPCGSGKKYKKCCLPRDSASEPPRTRETGAGLHEPEDSFTAELRPDLDEAADRLLERLERGERAGMERQFRALLEKNPQYHTSNFAMGVFLAMGQDDPVAALPFFEKAVRVFPPLAEAHYNLAQSYVKAARVAEAVEAFRKAIRYGDGDIRALAHKGLSDLERIIRQTSPFETIDSFAKNQKTFDLAFENLNKQNYEQAVVLFNKVLEDYPGHVQSYGNMGLAHAGLGHKSMALECLDKALAIDPSYEPAINNKRVIEMMTEGEPHIPAVFVETQYYRERLEAEKRSRRRWQPWGRSAEDRPNVD